MITNMDLYRGRQQNTCLSAFMEMNTELRAHKLNFYRARLNKITSAFTHNHMYPFFKDMFITINDIKYDQKLKKYEVTYTKVITPHFGDRYEITSSVYMSL